MTTMLTTRIERARIRHGMRMLAVAALLLLVVGLLSADSPESLVGFLLVSTAAFVPCALWLSLGAPGIPVLPAAAAIYFLYYAIPILRGNVAFRTNVGGDGWDVLHAAATASLFLGAATASWFAVLKSGRAAAGVSSELLGSRGINRIIFCGLGLGIAYYLASLTSTLDVGGLLGLIRSLALATTSVACFLLGHARARGSLRGNRWMLAVGGLAVLTILAWSSLFLVQGVMMNLAALLGYVITSKRIPWRPILVALPILAVLHAGKAEMRQRYWAARSNSVADFSLLAVPGEMTEWASAGVTAIASGDATSMVIDRASLLQLLLRVQQLTPDVVPYLNGETYALLPYMLVPRFVQEDKIVSQAAMMLLNIRFGFQTAEGASITAIGWGMIAEAYANFGDLGVAGIGIIIGLLTGFLTRWSTGQPATSLPSLIGIAGMMTVVNAESDFSYLIVNFAQAAVALIVMHAILQSQSKPRTATARATG